MLLQAVGAFLASALLLLPYFVFPSLTSLSSMPPRTKSAARGLWRKLPSLLQLAGGGEVPRLTAENLSALISLTGCGT